MEHTIYGMRIVRNLSASIIRAFDEGRIEGSIGFWKAWPDGAGCHMLEVRAEIVPRHKDTPLDKGAGTKGPVVEIPPPWLNFTRPMEYDPDRDWWVAPRSVRTIVLRLCRETYRYQKGLDLLEVTPRRPE